MTEPIDDPAPAKAAVPPPPRPLPPPPPGLAPPTDGTEGAEDAKAAAIAEAADPAFEATEPSPSPPKPSRAKRRAPKKAAKEERRGTKKATRAERKTAKKAARAERKAEKKAAKARRKLEPKPPREPIRPIYQLILLTRSSHPLQALVMAIAVGGVAAGDHRGVGGTLIAGAGVLLTQLALGLLNDAYDAPSDARGGRTGKPVASGALPRGNATFLAMMLVLLSLPVAALNGTLAGAALVLTLPVGFLHNRILHRTPASFLGWMLTFPLLVTYLAYGGWGAGKHGNMPTWQLLVASAGLGLTFHFLTSLPDLVADHKAGLAELPLVIARRTGATVLLVITVVCLIAAVAATVWCGLHFGLRHR